ncbi:MAG: 50S ribosomal protein L11 methyltransferase [Lysobacterales bacterium]|jgi:ribosomal protein L11 methyltransferase
MPWLEISVRVGRETAALVENLLHDQPVLALTMTDDADDPVLEPGVGETPLWPTVCITALLPGDAPIEPLTHLLSLVPGIDRPQQVSFKTLEDQQWERLWLDRFEAMRFGENLWVVPGDRSPPEEAIHVLRLDPGLAFGTGTHPTTRLCLEWIDGHDFEGRIVVDYGCGSGVLGIAAALKGAAAVIAVDNDPQALAATVDNAGRNGVAGRMCAAAPAELELTQADVVLANILAAPLIELAPLLSSMVKPSGALVLSGILAEQADDVAAAYEPFTGQLAITDDEGWVRLEGRKP